VQYRLPKRLRTLDHRDSEDLAYAYEREDSITEAAEHFDVQAQTVRRRLKAAGIHEPEPRDDRPVPERVVDVLAEHGEMPTADITLEVGVSRNSVYQALSALQEDGRVESRKDPEDGRRKLYALVDDPAHEIGEPIEDSSEPPDADATDQAAVDDVLAAKLPDGTDADDVEAAVETHGPNAFLEHVADELGLAVDTTRSVCHLTGVYSDVREGARMRGGTE
jgi:DNA-binding transcriptional ArsR family regulator